DSTQAGAAPPAPASPLPATKEAEPAQPLQAIQPVVPQTSVPPSGTVLAGGSSANPTPAIPSPSPSATATSTLRTYLVPYGDTLTQISTRFGVPVEDIMKANNIPNRDVILAGRTIVIPNPR
ncbi:MAG TPA: LysM domain-containing protein, partial [Chloroflexota bacterium]